MKLLFRILILGFSTIIIYFPMQAFCKIVPAKSDNQGQIYKFKGQFFYEVTMSDEEPPVTTECKTLGEAELKNRSSFQCEKNDEMTKLFWDWNCSKEKDSKIWTAIVLGGKAKCEKSLQNFRDRN